jgi:hypothetical protein
MLLAGGMLLFWGTIFGNKKRNDSYRLMNRLGVSEGKIWWNRMLPAILLYIPAFVCPMFCIILLEVERGNANELWYMFPMLFSFWLAPMVLGAFFSITFRSRIAAVFLTGIGIIFIVIWAAICGHNWFLFSSAWTTLPICIALLVASRLRTKDYLRKTYTWRSKFVSLIPVFATALAVLAAVPFVRVYSVPYVSWEQIETYLDQADISERLAPDKRKELIQFIANNNALPPGHENFFASFKANNEKYTYEEYLLLYFAHSRHVITNPFLYPDKDICCAPPKFTDRLRYTPWESARADRVLRFQIIASLVESGSLQDESAKSHVDWLKKWKKDVGGMDKATKEFL